MGRFPTPPFPPLKSWLIQENVDVPPRTPPLTLGMSLLIWFGVVDGDNAEVDPNVSKDMGGGWMEVVTVPPLRECINQVSVRLTTVSKADNGSDDDGDNEKRSSTGDGVFLIGVEEQEDDFVVVELLIFALLMWLLLRLLFFRLLVVGCCCCLTSSMS